MTLEELCTLLDAKLGVADFEDYAGAFNGLQLERRALADDGASTPFGDVHRVALSVDACRYTIEAAADDGAELLIAHHGLLWGGVRPFTGPLFERLAAAFAANLAVYACHLPLDAHPSLGNNAQLVRALGFEPDEDARFGEHGGRKLGYFVECDLERHQWWRLVDEALGQPTQLLSTGPERITRFAVLTGAGASYLDAAAAAGCDALLTGEASHHHYFEAEERGVNLCLGGHYATECLGVLALGRYLEETLNLDWTFIEHDTGL
ncbi:MAG: Nif3-like dinuclear metal center hexameric protein [Polyangia bacterium]|jgi:dinuclear metal center YbgI/SA1388 family protein|nr:Nif3-like dinuclear metal center hexameric protein [Polyangia bacterium]